MMNLLLFRGLKMIDLFAFDNNIEYVDYVSTNTFATVIIGLCTI